jgi:hypothetical protein
MSATFKKFHELTNDQQSAVKAMHPAWGLEQLRRFEYRLTKKGDLSRKRGDHRPTEDWSREIDRILGAPIESSASTGPTATRDQPIRRTGVSPMHLGSNAD